jgi:hypothetical protein
MLDNEQEQEEVSGVEESTNNEPQEQQPVQEQQSQSLTPEAIAAAVRAGMDSGQQQQQQQLTPEEVNQRMKVWNPDAEFGSSVAQAFTPNDDGQVDPNRIAQVFQKMHAAQMAQAQTYAMAMVNKLQNEFGQTLQPLQQQYSEQQKAATQKAFMTSYPALTQYKQLLPAAASMLQQSGANYQTKEQLFPALASAMEQMIKPINPQFSLGNANSGNQSGMTPASVMAPGHGGGSGAPANQKKSASIWG